MPPAEAEADYYAATQNLDMVAGFQPKSLQKTRDASVSATTARTEARLLCRVPFKDHDFPAIGQLCQDRSLVNKGVDHLVAAIADYAQL